MYKPVITLTEIHLKAKRSQMSTLVEWAFIVAAKASLKDGKTRFVEVTPINIAFSEKEPTSGNWYKVEGVEVSKFIPTFAVNK